MGDREVRRRRQPWGRNHQAYLTKAYDLKPLSRRPTAWATKLSFTYVRAPFTTPILSFPGSENEKDYTANWEENLKLVDQWLDNVSKVLDPDKVMFYVNWWRYYGHDTMFPEHSVDPFSAMAVGHAWRRGFHVTLHFHEHLVQDATTFYGRYVAKQDEWHRLILTKNPANRITVRKPTNYVADAASKVSSGSYVPGLPNVIPNRPNVVPNLPNQKIAWNGDD